MSIDQNESSYGQSILSELGLRVDDLIGRRVLDLGAGSAAFAKYVNQYGCDCISLDEVGFLIDEAGFSGQDFWQIHAPKNFNFEISNEEISSTIGQLKYLESNTLHSFIRKIIKVRMKLKL